MSLKLAARLVRIEGLKIADLQENDTAAHEEDISAFLPLGTVAIIIHVTRVTGAGVFNAYPNTHATSTVILTKSNIFTIPIKDRILKWSNSVANDDWDVFLHGYFVQKRTR